MAIAVHPFVTGQPHRIGALDAALDYICSHTGVWRATGWEIVQHFLAQQPEKARSLTPVLLIGESKDVGVLS